MRMALLRRFFYAVNILAMVLMVSAVVYSTANFSTIYKDLVITNDNLEKIYYEVLAKYKKTIVFVLKNNLPRNVDYFNSVVNVVYDLPLARDLKVSTTKKPGVTQAAPETADNNHLIDVDGCYNQNCIKVSLDSREILSKISDTTLWGHGEITSIPMKKSFLFEMGISMFLDENKDFIFITVMCFFVVYLLQTLFLLGRNFRLNRVYGDLLTLANKNRQDLMKQAKDLGSLCDSFPVIYEFIDEHFIHSVRQLIVRDVDGEFVNIIDILKKAEKFFSYQIVKKDLKISIDCEDTLEPIKSDKEVLFVVLLNVIFKSISRAKVSSDIYIYIRVFLTDNIVNIEIKDVGYGYQPKSDGKIQIYKLPAPVLENLCRKAKIIGINDTRCQDVDIVSIQIKNSVEEQAANEDVSIDIGNVIKIKLD